MFVGTTQAVLTGEILPPAQPKPLKTYSSAMREPGAMSELLRVIVWAAAAWALTREATKSANPVVLSAAGAKLLFLSAYSPVARDFLGIELHRLGIGIAATPWRQPD